MTQFIVDSSTLVELLHRRSRTQPNQKRYTFLLDRESQKQHLTSQQPEPQAQAIADFFGCLFADFIAVPVYPPDPARFEGTLLRLQAIDQGAQAPGFPHLAWLATDTNLSKPTNWQPPAMDENTIFFTYSPVKATTMAHQHCRFMECAWQAQRYS